MWHQRRELTPQIVALLITGILVLAGLTVWRLVLAPPAHPLLVNFSGETMGTYYTVKLPGVYPAGRVKALSSAIERVLEDVNAKMSTYDPASELSRFNASDSIEPIPMSDDTLMVMALALEVSAATGGAYDVTVGPLVNAWGFGPEGQRRRPTRDEVENLRTRVGYEKLRIDLVAGTAQKLSPTLYVDLSSVAKGFGVDKVAEAVDAEGISDYLIEIGGEVRTRGVNAEGDSWRVGIRKPVDDEVAVWRLIPLSGQSDGDLGRLSELLHGRR